MAGQLTQRYYRGQGRLYFYRRTADGRPYNGFFVGNVPELTLNTQTEQVTHEESYTGFQYTDLRFTSMRKGLMNVTFEGFDSENLERQFLGKKTEVTGTTITGETHAVSPGTFAKLGFINIDAVASVTDIGGAQTYTEGTDYIVNLKHGSLEIPTDSTIPASADGTANIEVNYTSGNSDKVAMLATETQEYYAVFEGLNTAENNNPVVVTAFRVSVDPAQQLTLIENGNTVNQFSAEMEVLYDDCQADEDDRFFRIEQLQAA